MRYSMFIGRFQPFHNGHKWLLEQRLKLGKKVCVAVMDIHNTEPEKNPYTTEEVLLNISEKMSEYLDKNLIKIISIPPIESVNYGRDVGYSVIEHIPPEEIKKISATNIRRKK
jgi:cytidyltransferase-like protein|tara:strand:+ start:384 stop:722 length:339 start_codon:yes stop_codon:yes gene_type:complete